MSRATEAAGKWRLKYKELEQERDQLKARVMELETVARTYVEDSYRPEPKYDAMRFDALVDVLNRQPPQFLEAHDREVAARATYEALGWMHAECCTTLDRGEDPRQQDVSDTVARAEKELGLSAGGGKG